MKRIKIDYGIDLGTTNSAIARMESGVPIIKKNEVQKDTTPSCVGFNKKQSIIVGDPALNSRQSDILRAAQSNSNVSNFFVEFKRTMGTDKRYFSPNMGRDFSSEQLSAELLKKLRSLINDEEVRAAVITIPAKFTINQRDATLRAAKLAGFEHCELLQEPIAAAMAFGLVTQSKDSNILVFDLGGGTFDAALVRVEDGIAKVIDTEGDNYLGGKNVDIAIVNELLIPHLSKIYSIDSFLTNNEKREYLMNALKIEAERAKILLSSADVADILSDPGDFPEDDEGVEIELDIQLTEEMLRSVSAPVFQKAINICIELLSRNALSGSDLNTLLLVGGPTHSRILRQMVAEQVTINVESRVDPMTVVAEGAALYAATVGLPDQIIDQTRDTTVVQLNVGYEPTTIESSELVTVSIREDGVDGNLPKNLFVDIVRSDKGWSSGRRLVTGLGEVIEVHLIAGRANSFDLLLFSEKGDPIPCEPYSFTIIQGTKISSATLGYNFSVEIKHPSSERLVVKEVKGLEHTRQYPATGIINELKTQKTIGPGIPDSFIKIPIYQTEHDTELTRAIYNEHVYDALIQGDQLPALLPENSIVNLTIRANSDRDISISADFPALEFKYDIAIPTGTVQKGVTAEYLDREFAKARASLSFSPSYMTHLDAGEVEKLRMELEELEKQLSRGRGDYDLRMQVRNGLRKVCRGIDKLERGAEWPATEEELKDTFHRLEDYSKYAQEQTDEINTERVEAALADFKEQIPAVIKERNVPLAKKLISEMDSIGFALSDAALGVQLYIKILREYDEEFDRHPWTDRNKARILINQGLSMAANNPSKQSVRALLRELFVFLPDGDEKMREVLKG
jgi:molecular chaperone DnaK